MEKDKGVMYMLGQIDSKLDSQADSFKAVWKKLEAHDTALLNLKGYRDRQKGQIAILSIIWGSISGVAIEMFLHFWGGSK